MFIPYTVDVPMQRWPIANWLIIGVTILVSVSIMFGDSLHERSPFLLQRGEDYAILQHLLSQFAHADIFHLAGNMIFLFCFGNAINAKIGHLPFVALYFLSAVVGDVAWLALGEGWASLGASGAIMGIVGAYVVMYPLNNVSVFYWVFYACGEVSISSFWVVGAYVGFDVWQLTAGTTGVAVTAHLGAFAFGVAIMSALVLTRLVRSAAGERNLYEAIGAQKA